MTHRIVKRLLTRFGFSEMECPSDMDSWSGFVERLSETLKAYDNDRYLVERSIELSSREIKDHLEREKVQIANAAKTAGLVSMGTLASGVAHELNNPLAGVKGFTELLLRDENLTPKQRERLEKIFRLSQRMAEIIDHLRRFSHQGEQTDRVPVNLIQVARFALDLLNAKFQVATISCEITGDEQASWVEGNANRLESVLQNLLVNSYDAFASLTDDRKKTIRISFETLKLPSMEAPELVLKYSDNAGGMSESTLARIFDPFYTTKEVGKGTGLGMSIVHQIVGDHKGRISVTSKAGEGSSFTIVFPAKAAPAKKDSRPKILVLDDEADIVDLLNDVLSGHFNVTTMTDPRAAVAALDNRTFDLLLTDVRMPFLTGPQVAKHARERDPGLPVVFFTGEVAPNLRSELDSVPGSVFVAKPFESPEAMVEVLFAALAKKKMAAA